MVQKKDYLYGCLYALIVSILLVLCWYYLKISLQKNEETFFGFGYLILCPYLGLAIYFALKGVLPGLFCFFVSYIFFFLICLFLSIYRHAPISIIDFFSVQLEMPFNLIALVSGLIAGSITTFAKRKKIAICSGVIIFLCWIVIRYASK